MKKGNQGKAEAALLKVLKAEVVSTPSSPESPGDELQEFPTDGLAGVLEQLRQRGTQTRGVDGNAVGS